ncbi:MAG: hypothetical protein LBU84_18940 [Prevotella sp.]|jgi:hypothetical protein|nr:hypothetical protein [Prevotella sp.]
MYGHNTQYGYDASGVKRWTIHETAKSNLAVPRSAKRFVPVAQLNISEIELKMKEK